MPPRASLTACPGEYRSAAHLIPLHQRFTDGSPESMHIKAHTLGSAGDSMRGVEMMRLDFLW